MAGKEGSARERMEAVAGSLAAILEQQTAVLAEAPVARAAEAERVGKAARALALAARSVTDLGEAVAKSRAREADDQPEQEDEDADELQPQLSDDAWDDMRACVVQRCVRFDPEPEGPAGAGGDDDPAGPLQDPADVGLRRERPPAPA